MHKIDDRSEGARPAGFRKSAGTPFTTTSPRCPRSTTGAKERDPLGSGRAPEHPLPPPALGAQDRRPERRSATRWVPEERRNTLYHHQPSAPITARGVAPGGGGSGISLWIRQISSGSLAGICTGGGALRGGEASRPFVPGREAPR